ncbi:hypothetical protein GWK47_037803 [Chionoecetes opilio]|uniref:Uncharacterized protein n=1 Tax=Chionoecetes opilio TaxID=41210 RepID=A0A8J5D250_CHIOP|nr:hypothetical protein GWK47_037803 [Chionoecetes opilio]
MGRRGSWGPSNGGEHPLGAPPDEKSPTNTADPPREPPGRAVWGPGVEPKGTVGGIGRDTAARRAPQTPKRRGIRRIAVESAPAGPKSPRAQEPSGQDGRQRRADRREEGGAEAYRRSKSPTDIRPGGPGGGKSDSRGGGEPLRMNEEGNKEVKREACCRS